MWKDERQSFGHALRGLKFLFIQGAHFRFHTLMTGVVIAAGILFQIELIEWVIVLLCCALVLGAEGINSALETALDQLHPEKHPAIGRAKDMAAGAVLILAGISALVGILIFWPYLSCCFN